MFIPHFELYDILIACELNMAAKISAKKQILNIINVRPDTRSNIPAGCRISEQISGRMPDIRYQISGRP